MSAPAPSGAETGTAPNAHPLRSIVMPFAMPLLFILMLCATLVTAFHSPLPNDLALTLAGPNAVTSQITAGLNEKSPGSFVVTETEDAAAAKAAVQQRTAVGAVVIDQSGTAPAVTTYIASGGGRSAAGTVQQIGAQIAAQMFVSAEVVELAPLAAQDPLGSGIFYILIYSTIGGFLALIVLTQVMPKTSLRLRYGVAAVTALVLPITVFGLASIFLDGFGIEFGQLVAVLGILSLYVLVVALVVILCEQFLGKASTMAVVPLTVFINFAAAGGSSPESMLPGFWQGMHSFWYSSGATEAVRDIIYFPEANPTRWIMQLMIWALALIAVTLIVEGIKTIKGLERVIVQAQTDPGVIQEHLGRASIEPRIVSVDRGPLQPTPWDEAIDTELAPPRPAVPTPTPGR